MAACQHGKAFRVTDMSHGKAGLKYSVTIGIGFLLDLGIAFTASRGFGLPLELAAAIGFIAALCVNYILLELWVFPARGQASLSATRLAATLGAAAIALGSRIFIIFVLGTILGNSAPEDAIRLGAGFGTSFVVNYLLARLIFKRPET
ncbi:MAG: hypothetical protein B7X53_07245 [Hyphomonas sp. 34-62-18]|nr:MAG: hypothetical protein B7X53_07245 [Hyphomonas sp. 34-62-18]